MKRSFRVILCAVLFATAATAQEPNVAPHKYAHYDSLVEPFVAKMTLAEKIGQMTQAELNSLGDLKAIEELCLGSVLSGGDSDPEEGNSLEAWTDTYDACQKVALTTRLKIPLLYGVDAVHGHNNIAGAVIFPHNIGLGCTRNPALVEQISRLTARDVRATGIQWAFAPCITVPRDDRWGRTYEGFSEDPGVVSMLGAAAVRGLQGDMLGGEDRVLACAKHFVADGGTVPAVRASHHGDLDAGMRTRFDQGDAVCDEPTLQAVHVHPYVEAIEAGVGSIMPSYSSWQGTKCTGSHYLLTELLKEQLGFQGFLISDYAAIDQVDPDYKTAIAKSINAGIDMAMVPYRHREFHTLLTELVNEGAVPMQRIDDAVTRILRVKAAMGLLNPDNRFLADRSLHRDFSSKEHRAVARSAVRESLVLLKNRTELLPFTNAEARIAVVGSAADDLGIQCGGWTLSWQGAPGNSSEISGTTILQGIRDLAPEGCQVEYSADGSSINDADYAIIVVGENPYAEGLGDDVQLKLSQEDQALIAKAEASSVPVVLIVISGRPLAISDAIAAADAVVAAWLPGSAGEGVADVLFGKAAATGRLGFSWPQTADDHPLNLGEKPYEPLFEFGHGLSTYNGDSKATLEARRRRAGHRVADRDSLAP